MGNPRANTLIRLLAGPVSVGLGLTALLEVPTYVGWLFFDRPPPTAFMYWAPKHFDKYMLEHVLKYFPNKQLHKISDHITPNDMQGMLDSAGLAHTELGRVNKAMILRFFKDRKSVNFDLFYNQQSGMVLGIMEGLAPDGKAEQLELGLSGVIYTIGAATGFDSQGLFDRGPGYFHQYWKNTKGMKPLNTTGQTRRVMLYNQDDFLDSKYSYTK